MQDEPPCRRRPCQVGISDHVRMTEQRFDADERCKPSAGGRWIPPMNFLDRFLTSAPKS
jgi:hypothetical protein